MQILERLRRHPAYWPVVTGLCGLVFVVLVFQIVHFRRDYAYKSPGTLDFIEYWTAGQLLRAGENPYDAARIYELQKQHGFPWDDPILMWNPPWLLVWIYPLLLLPFASAALIWLAVNAVLLLLSAALTWRALSSPPGKPLGIALAAAILFAPSIMALLMGQMSVLILVGVSGFFYFASRNRDFAAGMCLSLATIKPHVVYLIWLAVLWWVIAERRWKVIAGGVAVFVPTLAILTLLWPDWLPTYRTAMAEPPLKWATPTLGYLVRLLLFQDTPRAQFLPPAVGVLGFLAYALLLRPPIRWRTDIGPLLLVSVATAAYGWSHDQVVLLVPCLIIVGWCLGDGMLGRRERIVAFAGLSLISAVMLIQNYHRADEQYYLWAPGAVGAVYYYVWHALRSQPKMQAI